MAKVKSLDKQKINREKEIRAITKQIVREYKPEKIILFGSQVKGDADRYSDFDFIIIKKTKESFLKRLAKFPLLSVQADIFIYTPAEFKKMKKQGSIFLENALRHSQVIYEKSKTRS